VVPDWGTRHLSYKEVIVLKQGLNIILDAQWGSTGKGKLSGFLGQYMPDFAASSFGPNAGHTYVDNNGKATVFKCLPTSAIVAGCPALVMPDSVIEVEVLMKEALILGNEVLVHPRTAVLTDDDAKSAQITGRHLAGTMKGTGHALSKKMLRIEGVKLAKDVLPKHMVADTCKIIRDAVKSDKCVLMEMSQGFDLSLNHGHDYPYLTSRDITVGAALNSCGCPASALAQVIGCMRVYPIRVGNIKNGYSGPCHPDQTELTWADVASHSGGPKDLVEMTTVTKRTRRVFTFSMMQMKRFCEVNNPDWLFLNFIHYLDWNMHGIVSYADLTDSAKSFIKNVEEEINTFIPVIGTGAKQGEVVRVPRMERG